MIIGIGTDIMEINRIEKIVGQHGDSFLNKYFTHSEQEYARSKPRVIAQSLASAWVVKEAISKALGTGIRGDVTLKSISLQRNEKGAPSVVLLEGSHKKAMELSDNKGYKCFVSISHDNGMANAFVVIERKSNVYS